jgi:hypothetical protein
MDPLRERDVHAFRVCCKEDKGRSSKARLGAQRCSETCAQGLGAYLRLGFFSIFAQVE